ncbi:GntR family transcriptional regulator [Mycolicibacterium litorale]|uniref:GntR family transcriptional regulator n=1 Tax=Mycolicibacterium litorale TaxID=758802 RepID=A0AAD1IQ99_9MYCO|nr:GntR family transcriptional regulator [Mycolicibacterium litorale]MCV7418832.1 GntR family transcriptional regulator [Mycolicibacterium litorale]TDY00384.1 DNA-binding GntR family transcriptional regulator [Mycolicibacterium litorale]BBY15783.1 GntR family transcriptional regulator [Mycolicibacterium litorale]
MAYTSAASRIAAELRTEILHGQIAPGSRLSQLHIAERFGVSRIPVRDALQMLAGEGLVHPSSNATAVVIGMSIPELQELYELREAVEPVATQIAVPKVGRADILMMRKQMTVMESSSETPIWLAANAEFHAAIYKRAGRPRMIDLVEQLRRLTDRYLYMHLEVIGQTEHLHAEHAAILSAVESGDPALAAQLTREHLATSHDHILSYLLEHPSATGGDDLISYHDRGHQDPAPSATMPRGGRVKGTQS